MLALSIFVTLNAFTLSYSEGSSSVGWSLSEKSSIEFMKLIRLTAKDLGSDLVFKPRAPKKTITSARCQFSFIREVPGPTRSPKNLISCDFEADFKGNASLSLARSDVYPFGRAWERSVFIPGSRRLERALKRLVSANTWTEKWAGRIFVASPDGKTAIEINYLSQENNEDAPASIICDRSLEIDPSTGEFAVKSVSCAFIEAAID